MIHYNDTRIIKTHFNMVKTSHRRQNAGHVIYWYLKKRSDICIQLVDPAVASPSTVTSMVRIAVIRFIAFEGRGQLGWCCGSNNNGKVYMNRKQYEVEIAKVSILIIISSSSSSRQSNYSSEGYIYMTHRH